MTRYSISSVRRKRCTRSREGPHPDLTCLCYHFDADLILSVRQTVDPADEVTLSRKGAKSRRRVTGLRSKTTKARTHVDRVREPRAGLEKKLEARTRELSEAREQQAATAQVLQVIASSPGELEPVFEAILANATRICEAKFGMLYLWEGEGQYRVGALHGAPPRLAEERSRGTVIRPAPGSALGRVAQTKHTVHIADSRAEKNYTDVPPTFTPPGITIYGGARPSWVSRCSRRTG